MRQAIIIGGRPLLVRGRPFPKVPLGEGGWRIEVEGRTTSLIRLTIERKQEAPNGTFTVPKVVEINNEREPLLIMGPVTISAEIYSAGREEAINVVAVSTNGDGHGN